MAEEPLGRIRRIGFQTVVRREFSRILRPGGSVVPTSSDGLSDSDGGRVSALAGLLMASMKPSKPGGESKNSSFAGPESTV